jgi:hypothetical protein
VALLRSSLVVGGRNGVAERKVGREREVTGMKNRKGG